MTLCVRLWTGGFDSLYACQDFDFDRRAGLHSVPQRFGIAGAFQIARAIHALMFILLFVFFYQANLGWLGLIGVFATGALLLYQHSLVTPTDLSRMNAAFFTTNACVSVILFFTMATDALFFSR